MAPQDDEDENQVAIIYGSQTGTAEEVAWDLAREGRRRGFTCRDPCAMDDIALPELKAASACIFVIATTGQGDPPVNMRKLWQELTVSSLPKTLLHGVRYTVFGCGDSHYREFNYSARKLHRRLEGLGAQPFFRLGLGDDQHDFGLEQELDPWADEMWAALSEFCPVPPGAAERYDSAAECRYEVEIVGTAGDDDTVIQTPILIGADDEFEAKVGANEVLCTEEHMRAGKGDVRNVRISAPAGKTYKAGDVCVVWPKADAEVVRRFIVETLELNPRSLVRVRPAAKGAGRSSSAFPDEPVTLEEIFTSYIDISAVPTRHFFHVLSLHTDHELHKEKLTEFASRTLEAKDALYEYCKREKRSAAEIMWDFFTVRPPLAELLSTLPPMRPRRYSIASSPNWHDPRLAPAQRWVDYQLAWGPAWRPKVRGRGVVAACAEVMSQDGSQSSDTPSGSTFDLCVAIVEFKTKTGRECEGLCSSFLRRGFVGSPVRCSFERGTLTLPPLNVPLIFVCPGTGLSPCRALVQERHLEVCRRGGGIGRPKDLMFLGFRHREGDFLYSDEWLSFAPWLAVHTAFSRDDPERKVYVQDKIEEHGAHVCQLLDAGARIYVCGRSHPMPAQVFDSFAEVLHDHRGMSLEAAGARLRELQRAQRYICDTWG